MTTPIPKDFLETFVSIFGRESEEFLASLDGGAFVMSSVSSRLLGGNNPAFAALEKWFANAFSAQSGAEKSCLIFNGGYAANTSVLPALASSKDAVF